MALDGRERRRTPEQVAFDIAVRLGLLGIFVFMAFSVIRPFLPILIWSVILAVALYPVFVWLRARLAGHGWVAAILLTGLGLGVVFGPAAVLITSLAVTLERLAIGVADGTVRIPEPPAALQDLPVVGQGVYDSWTLAMSNFPGFFARYSHTLVVPGERLLEMVAALAGSVLVFAAAVVVAGLLFVPGPRLVAQVRSAAQHLVGARGTELVGLAAATIRNVARGVIGVAVLQTLVIGIGLIVAGVPHAGLLTLGVLIVCIAQIGPTPVLLPLLGWFWLTRETGPALLFTAYMAAAGVMEHGLKPLVMGKGLDTPMTVILVGVLGGTVAYGLPGLFLGPMLLALAYQLLVGWAQARMDAADPRDSPGA